MPKLTIDGKEIEVPKGTKVIEAAKQMNTDIPFYCYHPGLSIAGNCRMCLVEVEKTPKLQIACHTECADGMIVRTNTEKVAQTRKHVLEFLLVNHPLDCPVCDQAGECWLQDYYLNYGAYDSRVSENKVKKPKAVPIGPNVMLDAERCILCSRCVRFTDEITKTQELGIVSRGDHSEIQVFPGKELNNPYSGNVVDLCPVGALTDRDFRFKLRVWYLEAQDSVCNGCSRGCNISMQFRAARPHHAKGDRIMRLKPRYNEDINKWWMCDEGRYGYKSIDLNRIEAPLKREGAQVIEQSWEEIISEAARKIQIASGKIGVFLSPQLSNEDLYAAKKVFKDSLKLSNLFFVKGKKDGVQDDFLMRSDKNPNSKGGELVGFSYDDKAVSAFLAECAQGKYEGVIIFGQELSDFYGAEAVNAALSKVKWSIFIGSNRNLTSDYSTYVLPSAVYAEKDGTFTNFEGRIQKFNQVIQPLKEARAEWDILSRLAGELKIAVRYDSAEEIFNEMAAALEPFKDLNYEKLTPKRDDIRTFAEPMMPKMTQNSGLIFHNFEKPAAEEKKV